jgi:hypothetical protein
MTLPIEIFAFVSIIGIAMAIIAYSFEMKIIASLAFGYILAWTSNIISTVGIETQSIDGVFLSSDVGAVLAVLCVISLLYSVYLSITRLSEIKSHATTRDDLPAVLFHIIVVFVFVVAFSTIGNGALFAAGAAVSFFPIVIDLRYIISIINGTLP